MKNKIKSVLLEISKELHRNHIIFIKRETIRLYSNVTPLRLARAQWMQRRLLDPRSNAEIAKDAAAEAWQQTQATVIPF